MTNPALNAFTLTWTVCSLCMRLPGKALRGYHDASYPFVCFAEPDFFGVGWWEGRLLGGQFTISRTGMLYEKLPATASRSRAWQ